MKTYTPSDLGLPVEESDGASWTRYIPESEFEAELIKRAMATRNSYDGWEIRDYTTQRVAYHAGVERGDRWDAEGRLHCQLVVCRAGLPYSPDRQEERFPYYIGVCERPNAEKERAVAVFWELPYCRLCPPEMPEGTIQRGILPHRPLFDVDEE
jgi:hypothetical protein